MQLQEQEQYKQLILKLLDTSKRAGVDAAEISISKDTGLETNIRMQKIDTLEFHKSKSLGITVYKNGKKGSASSSDFSEDALKQTLAGAIRIASFTEADPCAGLAEAHLMAKNIMDLDLYHPQHITADVAMNRATECEKLALSDSKITNSDGCTFSAYESHYFYGNTHGFLGYIPSTCYAERLSLIAEDSHGMQCDGDYTRARDLKDLTASEAVAESAVQKTLARLGAVKINTCKVPVIFAAEVASSLIRCFLVAISGGNLYKKASFLLDCLGKDVFAKEINIKNLPHLPKGLGSAAFDSEGVATQERVIVQDGVLQSYILGSYSARKLGMQTTGNAGGVQNIVIESNKAYSIDELIKTMHKGVIIKELIGHGVNIVTGDYSFGMQGFWVDNGQIQHPIEEVTVAGNLRQMLRDIIAIGNDTDRRGNILTGSILIANMTVAGS